MCFFQLWRAAKVSGALTHRCSDFSRRGGFCLGPILRAVVLADRGAPRERLSRKIEIRAGRRRLGRPFTVCGPGAWGAAGWCRFEDCNADNHLRRLPAGRRWGRVTPEPHPRLLRLVIRALDDDRDRKREWRALEARERQSRRVPDSWREEW